jgi:UPF0716 protein FxsA
MFALLVVLFIAELWALVWVATQIGVLNTVALLVVMPVLGIWLVKRAGLAVFRRVQATLDAGGVPHREVIDGFLLLIAGVLLIVPGFITDAIGLLLLVPPVRIGVRTMLLRSFSRRTSFAFRVVDGMGRRIDIRDVRSRDITDITDITDPTDPRRLPPELDR